MRLHVAAALVVVSVMVMVMVMVIFEVFAHWSVADDFLYPMAMSIVVPVSKDYKDHHHHHDHEYDD